MSEAVSLGVPMLAVPIAGQFEQELNSRYLARLGYGAWARSLERQAIRDFLAKTDAFARSLSRYPKRDNRMLFACLDEIIARVARKKGRPNRLETRSMGSYEGR